MRGSHFFVDRSVVILGPPAFIKNKMHHGITEITPIRCKMKSAEACCLSYWVDFIPMDAQQHKCCLGWDIC